MNNPGSISTSTFSVMEFLGIVYFEHPFEGLEIFANTSQVKKKNVFIHVSTILVKTEIFQELLDDLLCINVQTYNHVKKKVHPL